MEVKVQIPFKELVTIVRKLTPSQKERLQKELTNNTKSANNKSQLTELLLSGPVFTEEQIKNIEETRKSINQWRTQSL